MIFRLSQKLAQKLKEDSLPAVPLDQNPYADWSAHLFTADRAQYIIVANTRSFYSVVMYGKGSPITANSSTGPLSSLREFMEADGRRSSTNGSLPLPVGVSALPRRWTEPPRVR